MKDLFNIQTEQKLMLRKKKLETFSFLRINFQILRFNIDLYTRTDFCKQNGTIFELFERSEKQNEKRFSKL